MRRRRRKEEAEEEAENEAAAAAAVAVAGRWPVKTVKGNDKQQNEITLKQGRRVKMKEKGPFDRLGTQYHTIPIDSCKHAA